MSVCYNPKINSTIIQPRGVCYGFHYFSHTFILNHSSAAPRWRQIITSSFPTYRAQGQLLTDPATGKLYLFGGYTTTDWVLAGKSEQLVVDEEKRTAQMGPGPWQVCYACNAVGIAERI
ncbi:hypothetical protein L227DRAFT_575448 [Lentinus tigrinus ALCF2SS1-6]|uniref:Galactose oxidase n=1 Tax=Lentinus tigrinus ALCF2SS1-6 TaxID=1328759 RepID=A0A5C2SAS7_9APHY|nr:hypothetical protein L227DRAFT_575448 [Lentinus tigrinus ALCF2SS1-6]